MAKPGKLDRRLLIQSVTVVQSTSGEVTETLTPLATVWASRWYVRGEAPDVGDGSTQQVLTGGRFTIRFRDDVLTNMVLTCEGDDFTITGIEEGGRRDTLTLYAVTRAA